MNIIACSNVGQYTANRAYNTTRSLQNLSSEAHE